MPEGLLAAEATDKPEKPKPTFHADLEDIQELGDVEIGDKLKLQITGKIVSINKHEDFPANITLEIDKTKFIDRRDEEE